MASLFAYDKSAEIIINVTPEVKEEMEADAFSGTIYINTTFDDARTILHENGFDDFSIVERYLPSLKQAPWAVVFHAERDGDFYFEPNNDFFFLGEEIVAEDLKNNNFMFLASIRINNTIHHVFYEMKPLDDKIFSRYIEIR